MSMSPAEIDTEIALWRDTLARVGANLNELDELPAYQRLKGKLRADPPVLTGVTLDRVSGALAAAAELWQHFLLLSDAVQRADAARASAGRILGHNAGGLIEAEKILTGPSITLVEGETPFAQRDLLASAKQQNEISPKALLDAMQRAFREAKDVVVRVDASWKTLRQDLTEIDTRAAALEGRALALGLAPLDEIATARLRIADRRAEMEQDPLGVAQTLERQVQPLIDSAKEKIDAAERERAEIAAALADANARISALKARNDECIALKESAALRVLDVSGLVTALDPALLKDLEGWLATITDTANSGRRKAALVGIERWRAAIEGHFDTIESAVRSNRTPLEQREELRGRLAALEAKAHAYAKRQQPASIEAETLFAEAKRLLYSRPTDLAAASALVAQYEAALNASIARP